MENTQICLLVCEPSGTRLLGKVFDLSGPMVRHCTRKLLRLYCTILQMKGIRKDRIFSLRKPARRDYTPLVS